MAPGGDAGGFACLSLVARVGQAALERPRPGPSREKRKRGDAEEWPWWHRRARELFGVPTSLIVGAQTTGGVGSEMIGRGAAQMVFDGPHDIERWDVRARRGDVEIIHLLFEGAPERQQETCDASTAPSNERYVLLALEHDGHLKPMSTQNVPQIGDRAVLALHLPDRAEALEILSNEGWAPIEKEA